ncbi:MAG TPA: indolepyruvate oxidoreductase subunit beta family protein, partial [Thermodesulfobacteriota bacterium]|nr:indolepyruvate oxidoreductase subunit beta family protein [Thermodesulfobacteriota bacterium]
MPRLFTILIPAVGGQGGGVLVEWLVTALATRGHAVQGVSLPGLAQRGGATLYYLEVALRQPADPPADDGAPAVVFAQHPTPGFVDLIVAQEFLELGRALEQGYGSERTTIVASTHRTYATAEKLAAGSGLEDPAELERLARRFSGRFVGFNAVELARRHGLPPVAVNAILLGALCALGILPLARDDYEAAIDRVGVAPAANRAAFAAGLEYVASGAFARPGLEPELTWDEFVAERAARLPRRRARGFLALAAEVERAYPPAVARTVAEALFRLADYQDAAYARTFLDWLEPVAAHDRRRGTEGDWRLTETFARHLATWMAYEDAVRVADLKTRPERFRRIERELGIGPEALYRVREVLRPDAEELYGLLPRALVARLLARWPAARARPLALPQRPITTTFRGFLRLYALSWLRPLRRASWRYAQEHAGIAEYRAVVARLAALDYELAVIAASTGQLVKGYGAVRRRTRAAVERLWREV